MDDRIFSTSIDLVYTFAPVAVPPPTDEKKLEFSVPGAVQEGTVWDESVLERARKATLETFAKDESASVQVRCVRPSKESRHLRVLRTARSISVKREIRRCSYFYVYSGNENDEANEGNSMQATLYKMGERVIAENRGIERVSYGLPNKHYVPVDMKYMGVDNQTP